MKETDELPKEEVVEEVVAEAEAGPTAEQRIHELEVEKARLEGRNEVLSKPAEISPAQENAWKAVVWQDIGNLPDEDFKAKYKMEKHLASADMIKRDFNESDAKTQGTIAELRAENQLMAKYPDYINRQDDIRDAIADLSPEVKRDPARLAKALERAYLADKAAKPTPALKKEKSERRIVDGGFEPPVQRTEKQEKINKGEIAAEYKPLARVFGIASEAERKELMDNEFIPMNLGVDVDGSVVSFSNPEVGFERKKAV